MPAKTVRVELSQIENFKIEAKSRDHVSVIDQPISGGGTDAGPHPLEYLFISLGSCIVTVANIIAKQKRLPITHLSAVVEGDVDTDVLMGKRDDVRAGFTSIRVHMSIEGDMSAEEKKAFLEEVDLRCPISDNISKTSSVEFFAE